MCKIFFIYKWLKELLYIVILYNNMAYRIKGTSNIEKQIAIYEISNDNVVNFYCANGYKTMSKEQLKEINSNPITSTHLMVKKESKDKKIRLLTMKEQYELFIKEANLLKELTNDKMNLFKTVSKTKTSIKLFYDSNPPTPEKILTDEMKILESCKAGAIIFGVKGKTKAFKYDVVSQYPSVMRSDKIQFPINKPEYHTITQNEFKEMSFYRYGIYHVKIDNIDRRLLTENENN